MGTTVGEISFCKNILPVNIFLIRDDAASAVRGILAVIKRGGAGRKFNIVVIRGANDHDTSGIKDTLEEEMVSLMFYHMKIQTHPVNMSSLKILLPNCKIFMSGVSTS